MQSTISQTGYERSPTERRTLGGALLFVVLVALALLAVAHPDLAGATTLGGVGGLLLGVRTGRQRA